MKSSLGTVRLASVFRLMIVLSVSLWLAVPAPACTTLVLQGQDRLYFGRNLASIREKFGDLAALAEGQLLRIKTYTCAEGGTEKSTKMSVQQVDPKLAQKLMAKNNIVVLDIRTPEEFQDGHIAGAINIDFLDKDFEKNIAGLDKNKSYLLHCASGNRSSRSLPVLKKQQFQSIYHLDGGMNAWKKAGMPVEK
ncbi:MAG TPA: rhodanese-like domain-containing protein [Clostridia bacterium]|nr:rhodanese-like domain-containing protein [Clostridia bacterium]